MSNLFSGKNLVIIGLVSVILAYCGFVGYSAFHKDKVEPNAPELILNKPTFEIGDQIQIKVKHNRQDSKYTVNWNVLDGYNFKNDYSSFGVDNITFGSGAVQKTFLVICNVNYIVEGEIKSYNLYVQVKIGNGPLPPPPGPNPPAPIVFPDEVYKLSSFAYNEFSKINHPKKAQLAQEFAAKIDSTLAMIAAGTVKTSEVALKELNVMNNDVLARLNIERSVVTPYFSALQARLIQIDDEVGFERIDNLKRAFTEMSVGLKAIK